MHGLLALSFADAVSIPRRRGGSYHARFVGAFKLFQHLRILLFVLHTT